ncbi:glycoside hydrolase family 12 protein [Mycena olivaceomarginata]|nr:glycoside hydrolase family 12 protein [Mycena olivaceomarginata]
MQLFGIILCALLAVNVNVNASPVFHNTSHLVEKRGAVLTGQFSSESEINGRFVLENNLWGESAATSGSQSSQVTATNGNAVTWHTTYTWAGGPTSVKSYANLDLKMGLGHMLGGITSIPTAWSWSYTSASSGLVSDVSYDLWLSATAGTTGASASSTYEVMVWLKLLPLVLQSETVSINGISWRLYRGTVKTWTIFSFVAPSEVTNYNSDLKPFFTYLTQNQGVPSSQFLVQVQAGTEPFVGSATLSTLSYSMSINV